MTYLLDVSALVALGVLRHEFHTRVARWARTIAAQKDNGVATCAVTEIGFIRVPQVPEYGFSVAQAREALLQLKAGPVPFRFLSDDLDVSRLPGWVKTARQVTDGHLTELARAHEAVLATPDRGIPRGFVIR